MGATAVPAVSRRGVGAFMHATSDARLLARVRDGDDAAFEVLYDRHHRGLLAFCRHMLGSQDDAEDVLQHVFIAAHRHAREDARPLDFKPWIYAVARNRCLSVMRGRRLSLPLDDVAEPSTDGLATAATVEVREDMQHLLRDMAGLPDDQRAALLLSELGDMSHDQIGATLGVPRTKVKALVFQARESLMNARRARETDCREIQEQLATLSGGALRRTNLRRHVATCPACAAFKAEVNRQKAAMAAVLPVLPSALLKDTVLAAVLGGGGTAGAAVAAGGAAAGAGAGGLLAGSLVAKGLAVVAVAGTLGGGVAAVDRDDAVRARIAPVKSAAPAPAAPAMPASARPVPAARVVAPYRPERRKRPASRRADVRIAPPAMSAPVPAGVRGKPQPAGRPKAAKPERVKANGRGHAAPRPVKPVHGKPAKPKAKDDRAARVRPAREPAPQAAAPATGDAPGKRSGKSRP
jgi:RNA polymerase sigma factor (sigma-70 family)